LGGGRRSEGQFPLVSSLWGTPQGKKFPTSFDNHGKKKDSVKAKQMPKESDLLRYEKGR